MVIVGNREHLQDVLSLWRGFHVRQEYIQLIPSLNFGVIPGPSWFAMEVGIDVLEFGSSQT